MPENPIPEKYNKLLAWIFSILAGLLVIMANWTEIPAAYQSWMRHGVEAIAILSSIMGWGVITKRVQR